jgi:hypothetical protein
MNPKDNLIDLILILLTAGTSDNNGHMHGLIDQRSRAELERLILKLEAQK